MRDKTRIEAFSYCVHACACFSRIFPFSGFNNDESTIVVCTHTHTHIHTHIRQSLICACVPTDAGNANPEGHTVTRTHIRREHVHMKIRTHTKAYESPRTTTPPLARCYCCDLMKCYGRPPAITFPLHRLTPHLYGSIPRDEIPFLFNDPPGDGFCQTFGDFPKDSSTGTILPAFAPRYTPRKMVHFRRNFFFKLLMSVITILIEILITH